VIRFLNVCEIGKTEREEALMVSNNKAERTAIQYILVNSIKMWAIMGVIQE
jgi:hypothetical protein